MIHSKYNRGGVTLMLQINNENLKALEGMDLKDHLSLSQLTFKNIGKSLINATVIQKNIFNRAKLRLLSGWLIKAKGLNNILIQELRRVNSNIARLEKVGGYLMYV